MDYALDKDNNIVELSKGATGFCPECGEKVFAKCGQFKEWHFSHYINSDCTDGFGSDGMCQWHIDWQNKFPEERREVRIIKNNKLHIADAITKNGIIVEFQHSPISPEEIAKREEFYKDMIWIFDGSELDISFETNFPYYGLNKDQEWTKLKDTSIHKIGQGFISKKANNEKVFFVTHKNEVKPIWNKRRQCIETCTKQAFIDLGEGYFMEVLRISELQKIRDVLSGMCKSETISKVVTMIASDKIKLLTTDEMSKIIMNKLKEN